MCQRQRKDDMTCSWGALHELRSSAEGRSRTYLGSLEVSTESSYADAGLGRCGSRSQRMPGRYGYWHEVSISIAGQVHKKSRHCRAARDGLHGNLRVKEVGCAVKDKQVDKTRYSRRDALNVDVVDART